MGRTACTEPQCLYSRAIPLLPLWAVRPLQSLSACTRGALFPYLNLLNTKIHIFQINVLIQILLSSTCLEHRVFITRKIICTCSFLMVCFPCSYVSSLTGGRKIEQILPTARSWKKCLSVSEVIFLWKVEGQHGCSAIFSTLI
jgi:hypothetical protein